MGALACRLHHLARFVGSEHDEVVGILWDQTPIRKKAVEAEEKEEEEGEEGE